MRHEFTCQFATKEEDPIVWTILPDGQHIEECEKSDQLKNLLNPVLDTVAYDKNLTDSLFVLMWPDLTGCAKTLLDDFYLDKRVQMYNTHRHDNIWFYDVSAIYPDTKVCQCLRAIIAVVGEIEDGFNCWKSGPGHGRKYLPDFCIFVPENKMRCFVVTAAFMFADRKWWYKQKCDINWEMFMPTVNKWNSKRTHLLLSYLLILDKSMVGWKPKTYKCVGLPNCSYEPRKPVDYGTMLRDSADCVMGVIIHIDPTMCPEKQARKEFSDAVNPIPNASRIHEEELLVHVRLKFFDS